MGYWEVLDLLEKEEKWFSSKDIMIALDYSYNTVNKHLRKLLKLKYIIAEDDTKNVKNYRIAFKLYKASKFISK